MALKPAQTLGTVQPTGKRLKWPNPSPEWQPIILEVYLSAKKNPVRKYWYQSDVTLFWLLCDEYHEYRTATLEPNAALLREVRSGFDRLGVSLYGRLSANLVLQATKEAPVSNELVLELADRLQAGGADPIVDAEVIEDGSDGDETD